MPNITFEVFPTFSHECDFFLFYVTFLFLYVIYLKKEKIYFFKKKICFSFFRHDIGVGVFGCFTLPDSTKTKLKSSNQKTSSSLGKYRITFIALCCIEVSLQLFQLLWIFLSSLGRICYNRFFLIEGHKRYFKD